jgi:CHAD domain-containing protein
MRPTLKKVLGALGEARDLDVALLELDAFNRALPEADRAALEPLKQHLRSQRARARAKMLSLLDSSAVQKDLDELRRVLTQPSDATQGAGAPVLDVVPELIRTRYKKVRKGAGVLTSESPTESYHAVRGNVKKLRYALESVAVILGKPADGMVRSLRRWQEELGMQQDADVAGRRLQALATVPPKGLPPETLFVMGRLAAHYTDRASRARKRHPRAYRKVRRRWKTLKSKLQESAPGVDPLPGPGP